MPKQSLQPVALQERIQTIDIIRGFALFGVLVINFTVDNRNIEPEAGWTGIADQLTYWPIRFFMDDKFMATYCFLFGLGFSIQMLRAEARNSPFVFVYIRRFFALYLIGVIHQILTDESILPSYAVVGFVLLLLHKLPRKLLPILRMVSRMTDVFSKEKTGWRSINSDILHHIMYLFIIAWELTIAILSITGIFKMINMLKAGVTEFNQSKKLLTTGLSFGVVLWFGMFITIGGEWFLMWQSKNWNGQNTAFSLCICFLLFLIHLNQRDD